LALEAACSFIESLDHRSSISQVRQAFLSFTSGTKDTSSGFSDKLKQATEFHYDNTVVSLRTCKDPNEGWRAIVAAAELFVTHEEEKDTKPGPSNALGLYAIV
jgi:hypothetical protein